MGATWVYRFVSQYLSAKAVITATLRLDFIFFPVLVRPI